MPLADYEAMVECWEARRTRMARVIATCMADVANLLSPYRKRGGMDWVKEDFLPRRQLTEEEIWQRIERAFPESYSQAVANSN
jgi:hypothetical protein